MASTAFFSPSLLRRLRRRWVRLAGTGLATTMAIALSLTAPAQAGDPFRTSNPRAIGDQTEAAFRAMFEYGNYTEAEALLATAEADEPMAHAMAASIAYLEEDWDAMGENAARTLATAEELVESDPLRGNLYIAVGHFMEGAHAIMTQGTLRGSPTALRKLQQVFSHIREAEDIAPDDPELNLIKGFMDLMIAVNLPLADPADAIARLETYAAPAYISQRGIAIACRDLDDYDCAINAIEAAIAAAPNNPDLEYLRAQVLVNQGDDDDSIAHFDIALANADHFPRNLRNQIAYERCRANNRANDASEDCADLLDRDN